MPAKSPALFFVRPTDPGLLLGFLSRLLHGLPGAGAGMRLVLAPRISEWVTDSAVQHKL